MAQVTINGRRASTLRVILPRVGRWTADATVDSAEALTDPISVAIDGLSLSGAIVRGRVASEVWTGRIVGGNGGLSHTLPATPHRACELAEVLNEVLRESGELLADDAGDLTALVEHWQRIEAPAHFTVAEIAKAAGYAWRVRADGLLWLGAESWPAYAPPDVEVASWNDRAGLLTLSGSTLGVTPGQTLTVADRTLRVGVVEHVASAESLRTLVHEERG